ncbi:MAG: cache domain-containing protein [Desulfobulbales bacterium]|nr:cache domain-containing protein [Desulfobulbales bacterium]
MPLRYKSRIRVKIVLPLLVFLAVSAALLVYGVYLIEKKHFTSEINFRTAEVRKLLDGLIYKETKFMRAQLRFLDDDPVFLETWRARDREALYNRAQPVFEEMLADFNVTHFYFIEPDGTCFLRVHAPHRYGDRINRFTFEKAVADSETAYGVELGPLGSFTLRVVYPWIKEGRLLGYLELGEEIEHLVPRVSEITGVDLVYTIDKSFLDREAWQGIAEGDMVRKGDWDKYEQFVLIENTLASLPRELEEFIVANHLLTNLKNISVDDRLFSVCVHPLRDASGRQVGSTMLIVDISEITSETRETIFFLSGLIMIISLLFLIFYYIYSGRIGKQMFSYQHRLEDLVRERTRDLQIALDEVKVLSGYLPICASCKQIRDDNGYWTQLESYIREHSEAEFSHGICPDCAEKLYPDFNSKLK